MNDLYKIFGLDENCGDEELERAYSELKAKYSEERFCEGEAGNEAAKKLTELETAYAQILSERREKTFSSDNGGYYTEIEKAIKSGDITRAQSLLDEFNERNAEWHYLQSVVFYKKNWSNESKKQLEIAIQMDPDNQKYKNSYRKLTEQINGNEKKTFTDYSGNGNYSHGAKDGYDENRQMGGDGCLDFCCQLAICNVLLNCCCNCR